jgi:hypothetical protein
MTWNGRNRMVALGTRRYLIVLLFNMIEMSPVDLRIANL